MGVELYRSTDASAPVMTGESGSLITVLDAVLVNGYGSKPAAGWTKAFSGTNAAVYRQATAGASGFYLDVNDNNPIADGGKNARIRGYEVASGIGAGTNPFPTTAQQANGLLIIKSTETPNATPVDWYILANERCFYLWIRPSSTYTGVPGGDRHLGIFFGDFISYKTSDPYKCAIVAPSASTEGGINVLATQVNSGHVPAYAYTARSHNGSGSSITTNLVSDYAKINSGTLCSATNTNGLPYPNGPDSALYAAPVYVIEVNTRTLRGVLPGIYAVCHYLPLNSGDVFNGVAGTALAGKTFRAATFLRVGGSLSIDIGQALMETSNTWYI